MPAVLLSKQTHLEGAASAIEAKLRDPWLNYFLFACCICLFLLVCCVSLFDDLCWGSISYWSRSELRERWTNNGATLTTNNGQHSPTFAPCALTISNQPCFASLIPPDDCADGLLGTTKAPLFKCVFEQIYSILTITDYQSLRLASQIRQTGFEGMRGTKSLWLNLDQFGE